MAKHHYSHKQIRKSIKKDELRDLIDKSADYVRHHTENILITVVIAVVVIVLIPLYFNNRAENERRASGLLSQAVRSSVQPVSNGSGSPFQSVKEKYEKVKQSYAEISATYKNTHAAALARMGEADAMFYLAEYGQAEAVYQELLLKVKTGFLRGLVQEKLAACLENTQKWQDAVNTYQALLAEQPNYFNREAVRMGMARCYAGLGKIEESRQILTQELSADPGSYWAEIARQQLQEK